MEIKDQILYEDNHLLVINKLPGQIVQGDKTGDAPLSELLKDFVKKRDNKPGNVFMGVVHRLDRPVSGVVVFAKTSKALSRMNELFKSRETQKTYWAVVKNKPIELTGKLVHFLIKNEKQNKSYASETEKKGSLKCELDYALISSSDTYFLLEVNPLTGRHHQIRVQLASLGCPIKGDLKYGFNRSNPDGSIHLHARQLKFMHPIKQEEVVLVAPVPNEIVWKSLEKNLS